MDRRTFFVGTGAVLLAAPRAAEAQAPPKIHRVGLLSVPPAYLAAFEESLRQLGYVRGQEYPLRDTLGRGSHRTADQDRRGVGSSECGSHGDGTEHFHRCGEAGNYDGAYRHGVW